MTAVTVTQAARLIAKAKRTALEDSLYSQLMVLNLWPVREYRFHPVRKWRFDLAFIDAKLAVEIEGGQYIRGRHQRPGGFARDMDKYNSASRTGWKVLRYTGDMVKSGQAAREIAEALNG